MSKCCHRDQALIADGAEMLGDTVVDVGHVYVAQLGDGLTNAIYPTSSTMLGFLAASKIPYSVWLKYVIKLVILLSLVSMAFLALAVVIGY